MSQISREPIQKKKKPLRTLEGKGHGTSVRLEFGVKAYPTVEKRCASAIGELRTCRRATKRALEL